MTDLGTPQYSHLFNAPLLTSNTLKIYDRVSVCFNEFLEKFGFEPDKFSYGMLVKALSEMGSFVKVLEVLNETEEGFEIGVYRLV